MTNAQLRRAFLAGLVVATLTLVSIVVTYQTSDPILLAYWFVGAAVIATCLVAFVIGRRFTKNPIAPGRVLCIVPTYNEDPAGLHGTVRALLAQTVPVDIVVVDDGSAVPVIPSLSHRRLHWIRQENRGKRGAQVAVLRMFDRRQYQYILTVDSDSEPYPDACEHLLRAMSDPKVQAATGMIYIRNYAKTWVSMAADIDIGTSCVMMRASRSMLGALETTSGALALYRSELLYDHLDAYEVECGTGDDRWLALRALRRGEVVAVAEARVETDMPTTLSGTYKQRVRWARSWWWMLPYVFRHLSLPKLLSPLYGLVQLAITPAVFLYIVIETILSVGSRYSGHGQVLSIYLLAYAIVRYAASGLYLVARPRLSLREKLVCWIVGTPGAIVLNILWLTPIRYFALSKLLDNRWQTREVPNAEHQSNVPSVPCLTSYAPRSHENVTVSGDIRSMAGSSRATSYVPRHSKENVTARSAMNEVRSLTGGLSRPTSYGPRHSYENVMARSALGDVSSLPAASRRLPAPRQCLDGGVTQIIQQVHDHDRTVRLPVQPTDMDATIRFERVR